MADQRDLAAAMAEGRPRSASGLSLRPALGSITRMRSRSLLKGSELAVASSSSSGSASTSNLGHFAEEEPVKAERQSAASNHAASQSAPSPVSAASSTYGFESDFDATDGTTSTLTDDSDLGGPYTPTDNPSSSSPFTAKLPFPMPRRGTFSRIAAAAANPFGAIISTPPRLNRQQSYLALSIPPTPGVGSFTSNMELRGDDEDRRLPSPVTESAEEHTSHSGLAARPISTSNAPTSTATTLSSQRIAHAPHTLSKLLPPVFFLLFLFSLSLLFIYFAVSTIPVLSIPHNLSQIREQSTALRDYARRGWTEGIHVSAVLSAIFVFKQAFSVPGSILVNILFGSLYGTYAATICACIFTGVGSVCAYYMARLCGPLVERYFPRALASTRSALLGPNTSAGDMFSYLLLARLFPLLPYSVLNIACGVLAIPVKPYFITLVLGSFPYNFVTTQLGDLLGSLASTAGPNGEEGASINAIWTWDLCFKLAVASVLSAAPLLFKEQLKTYLGGDKAASPVSSRAGLRGRSGTEAEKMAALAAREAEYSNFGAHNSRPIIPLLRRDRTDSTASEILVYPPPSAPAPVSLARQLSQKRTSAGHPSSASGKHSKKWSFSWSDWRHSPTNDSGDSTWSAFSSTTNSTSDGGHEDGGESGDTDEEDARERRISDSRRSSRSFEAPMRQQNTQRRTASIESTSAALGKSQSPGNYFFDDLPQAVRQPSPTGRSSGDWDRF